ncbi:MAG: hypothetical protein MR598_03910 [Erysipelotrichaceae bacterium]|nr:hypothetical protein [Erysipelotrichaceae bacterium]
MNLTTSKEDKNIKDLLDITYVIQTLYENLANFELEENHQKYQENLENLKIAINLENKIYSKIPSDKTKVDRMIRRITYLNTERKEDTITKILILERIKYYLTNHLYMNPFLSTEKMYSLQKMENQLAVLNQYNKDYNYLSIYLVNRRIDQVTSKEVKALLIEAKYQTIMAYKAYEHLFLFKPIVPETIIQGRQTALLFNQEQTLIEQTYFEQTSLICMSAIENLLNLKDFPLDRPDMKHYLKEIKLIELESALRTLEKEEFQQIFEQVMDKMKAERLNQPVASEILDIFIQVKSTSSLYKSKRK